MPFPQPPKPKPEPEELDTGTKATQPARDWRLEQYLDMGFSTVDANLLADAKQHERDSQGRTWTHALDYKRVADALHRGATFDLVLSIYT